MTAVGMCRHLRIRLDQNLADAVVDFSLLVKSPLMDGLQCSGQRH